MDTEANDKYNLEKTCHKRRCVTIYKSLSTPFELGSYRLLDTSHDSLQYDLIEDMVEGKR